MEAGENQKQFSTGSPTSLGNLAQTARFPLSHRADYGLCFIQGKSKGQNQNPKGGGLMAASPLFHKADRSLINKTGQLTC